MKYKVIFLCTITMTVLLFIFATMDINTSTKITGVVSHSVYAILNWIGDTEYTIDEISFIIRKLGHFAFYALLASLLATLFLKKFRKLYTVMILSGAVMLVISFMDEFIQHNAKGRNSSFFDIAIDMSGAVTGLLIFTVTVWAVGNRQNTSDRNRDG